MQKNHMMGLYQRALLHAFAQTGCSYAAAQNNPLRTETGRRDRGVRCSETIFKADKIGNYGLGSVRGGRIFLRFLRPSAAAAAAAATSLAASRNSACCAALCSWLVIFFRTSSRTKRSATAAKAPAPFLSFLFPAVALRPPPPPPPRVPSALRRAAAISARP